MQIIENILNEEDFKDLSQFYNSYNCPWYYNNQVNQFANNNFYFTQLMFENGQWQTDWAEKYITNISKKLTSVLNSNIEILRAKSNLFVNRNKKINCGFHTDFLNEENYYTLVYYINTNNGGTQIKDGEFYPSIANAGLLFYGNVLHESVTQTDTPIRLNLNINFRTV